MYVEFKSFEMIWRKEKDGKKNNTVRKFDSPVDPRKMKLDNYEKGKIDLLWVHMVKDTTGEGFYRKIKDVTIFEDLYIITWEG